MKAGWDGSLAKKNSDLIPRSTPQDTSHLPHFRRLFMLTAATWQVKMKTTSSEVICVSSLNDLLASKTNVLGNILFLSNPSSHLKK